MRRLTLVLLAFGLVALSSGARAEGLNLALSYGGQLTPGVTDHRALLLEGGVTPGRSLSFGVTAFGAITGLSGIGTEIRGGYRTAQIFDEMRNQGQLQAAGLFGVRVVTDRGFFDQFPATLRILLGAGVGAGWVATESIIVCGSRPPSGEACPGYRQDARVSPVASLSAGFEVGIGDWAVRSELRQLTFVDKRLLDVDLRNPAESGSPPTGLELTSLVFLSLGVSHAF